MYYSIDEVKVSTQNATTLQIGPEGSFSPEQFDEDYLAFRRHMDQKNAERRNSRKNQPPPPNKTKKTKRTKRRRAKKTPQTAWLKELICPFVFGQRNEAGIWPSVTKESFTGRWSMGIGLPSLPNYRLLDHFKGQETLYFFGNGWRKAKR